MYKFLLVILISNVVVGLKAQTNNNDFAPKQLQTELAKLNGSATLCAEIAPLEEKSSIKGKFFSITNKLENSKVSYVYVGRVKSCRAGGCSIYKTTADDYESEYFDYFILYNKKLSVELIRVYNYQATHGQEVTNKSWLKQFTNYDGSKELNVGKNIDAISGATISVYGIVADVEHKTKMLKEIVHQ